MRHVNVTPPTPKRREPLPVNIRGMIARDLGYCVGIDNDHCHPPVEAWDEEYFRFVLRQRNCLGMVAEIHSGDVVGFMIYALDPREVQLLNFGVGLPWERRSVGTQMIDRLKAKLSSHRRSRIMLELCETSLDAQLFFRAMGFRAVKVMRGEFGEGASRRDAIRMAYDFREAGAGSGVTSNAVT